ncbi:flagellar filament capping protein FliD [Thermodesulfobacteriota bacterium]
MVNPIGGLASGIDSLALLDEMMDAASSSLYRLEDKRSLLQIKKDSFNVVNDQLYSLKSSLLELKLETTFKSKIVTSSDDTILTGTATTEAAAGAHTINISQLATAATARSMYTNSVLVPNPTNTAGMSTIYGRSIENIEGRYAVAVTDEGGYYKAVATFTPSEGGTMKTVAGNTTGVESASVAGTIATSISSSETVTITAGSDNITIYLDATVANVTKMNEVAADITDKINSALNTARNTTGMTYVVARATGNVGGANDDGFEIYSMNNETITVTGGSGTAHTEIGYGTGGTQSISQTISNTVSANNLSALYGNMNDKVRGLIRGITLAENTTTGLTTGNFEVDVNSELSVTGGTPTYAYGGLDVATGASLSTNINGLNNAGFSTAITGVTDPSTSVTSGTFTINGIQITIGNIGTATVNDVLGMINGSAAAVTASYSSTTDSFTLVSNVDGSSSISLGGGDDTTNFLDAAKLNYTNGATLVYGNRKGSIDKGAALNNAGFSRSPSSGTFTINGTTMYVDSSSDSIESLIEKINNSAAGVIAAYDAVTDKFSLSTDQNDVDTNTNNITIGDVNDSSNILNILNLQGDFYTTLSGTVDATARAADEIIIAPPTGSATNITLSATTASGAYQTTAGTVNWIDGIKDGGTFTVLAGAAGATSYTWTNNSGAIISDIDTFVSEWNDITNWSGSNVEVGVIKEGDNQIRFFSRSQGAGAEFTLTAHSAYDLYELGVVTTPPSELSATATSPSAVFHFNEGSGGVAADATTFANDGTVSGALWTEGDFFSQSLDFDGIDDYVEVTGSASLNLNTENNFTVEAWVKPDSYSGGVARIISKTGIEIYLDQGSQSVYAFVNGATSATVQSNAVLPATFTDEWYHIAVTYDSTAPLNSRTKIYINGTNETIGATDTVAGAITDDLSNMYIGNDIAGAGNAFDGQIDEVAFYKGVGSTKDATAIATDALTTLRSETIITGDSAATTAQYNALSYAYDMNTNTSVTGINVTTDIINDFDATVGITLESNTLGYYGYFGLADEDTTTPAEATVVDYFGADPVTSTYTSDIAIGTSGSDAYFSVNNVNYTRTSNKVDDVIGGATLNLKNTSGSNIVLNIEVDTERALERLTDYVVVHNRTLALLNPEQLTDFQKGYLQPLSDDEKANMTDSEISLYDGFHKQYNGVKFIQQESSFRRLYEYFRRDTTGNIDGLPDSLNSITDINIIPGLLGTNEDARKGYLISAPSNDEGYRDYIRDALESNYSLKNALENDSDKIFDLFANDSSVSGGSDGLARQMTDKIDTYILTNGILKDQIKVAGAIDKDMSLVSEQILRWQIRLEKKEETYWKKFIRMENAIAELTRQSTNLTGMLAKLGGG